MIQFTEFFAMKAMTHLNILRRLVLESIAVWLLLFSAIYWHNQTCMIFFLKPFISYLPGQAVLFANQILAPLTIPLEFSFDISLVLSLPILLIQLWRFIRPGLYVDEQKAIGLFTLISLFLLISGLIFAWYWVLPFIMELVSKHVPQYLLWMPSWVSLYHFVIWVLFFFGLAFQLPLGMWVTHYLGIYDYQQWRALRRVWIVIAFTLGMILTPPDVMSQIIVAIPLCLLYEFGLLMIRTLSFLKL
jgi:sec-independent protein translocase protein TatC